MCLGPHLEDSRTGGLKSSESLTEAEGCASKVAQSHSLFLELPDRPHTWQLAPCPLPRAHDLRENAAGVEVPL